MPLKAAGTQRMRAAHVVLVERVAAIDDDVAVVEQF